MRARAKGRRFKDEGETDDWATRAGWTDSEGSEEEEEVLVMLVVEKEGRRARRVTGLRTAPAPPRTISQAITICRMAERPRCALAAPSKPPRPPQAEGRLSRLRQL